MVERIFIRLMSRMAILLIETVILFLIGLIVLRLFYHNLGHLMCISAFLSIVLSILIDSSLNYLNEIDKARMNQFSQSMEELPVVLWWTPFIRSSGHVRECYSRHCTFTDDRRFWNTSTPKALAFYGSSFNVNDLPLPRNAETWALLHEESPQNNPIIESVLSLFNFTSTFSRYSHLPLTLLYVDKMTDIRDLKYFVSTKKKNELRASLAPILYVQSNCNTLTDRDAYVLELSKFIKIDSYGNCLHNADLPETLVDAQLYNSEEFLHFVSQYKFTLIIENAVCDDYTTEKLWRTLIVGSVPIYFGSTSVRDWLPNFDSAVLIDEFNEPEQLASYIRQLDENDARYEDYLQHKLHGDISNKLLKKVLRSRRWWNFDSAIEEFECQLCLRLHRPCIEDSPVDGSHYVCDVAKTVNGKSAGASEWQSIFRSARCDGIVAQEFILQNFSNYTAKELHLRSIQLMINGDC